MAVLCFTTVESTAVVVTNYTCKYVMVVEQVQYMFNTVDSVVSSWIACRRSRDRSTSHRETLCDTALGVDLSCKATPHI